MAERKPGISYVTEIKRDPSAVLLVLTNLFVIALAAAERWDLGAVMLIYWFQNVIIGIFNVIKMLTLKDPGGGLVPVSPGAARSAKAFMAVFFTLHYGMFQFGYFSFLRGEFKTADARLLFIATAAFFINHLVSFLVNFRADSADQNIARLMVFPYARIIPMHVTIIAGGFISLAFRGSPSAEIWILVFFLVMKAAADVRMHLAEHNPLFLPKGFPGVRRNA